MSPRPTFNVWIGHSDCRLNVVFPKDTLFTPAQAKHARFMIAGFKGERMDDRLVDRISQTLEGWLDGLVVRGELWFHPLDRKWIPAGYDAVE